MPMTVKTLSTGGTDYCDPFVGRMGPAVHVKVDISGLTVDEVDAAGKLKPGVPLTSAGLLCGNSPDFIYGVVPEATLLPLAVFPPTNTTLGSETADCLVALGTSGLINRDLAEDNLGRAYTANEIAGFDRAGSKLNLTTT